MDEILTAFFRMVVTAALNPVLDLLGHSLLATPDPSSLPRIGELWNASWQVVLTCYATVVVVAGLIVMAHQTLQTRYRIREILPRLVLGVVAGAASMLLGTQAITIANALSGALLGDGLDPNSTAEALKNLYLSGLASYGIVEQLLAVVFVIGLIAVLVTYVVRVVAVVILLAGAPLALMAHGLPQTEGIAFWWWRAFGGVLAVQVAQSLTLITALKVLLAPGFTPLGPTSGGLVNLLIGLALVYVLVKEPFWILGAVRRHASGGRSLVGGLARAYVMGKAFGHLRGDRQTRPHTWTPEPSPRDPRWPAPIRTWWGVDGQHSPAAMARRIRDWQGIERARRPLRLPPGQARFLQPITQVTTHDLAETHAAERPAMTTFRPATPDPASAGTPMPRPVDPPHPMQFRPARPPAAQPEWSHRSAPVSPVRFRPATPPARTRPVHADGPPAPAVFQDNVTPPPARRARTHTPAPVYFRPEAGPTAPAPKAYPPPATPLPQPQRPITRRTPRPVPVQFQAPTSRRRSGGGSR
ncbi:hypothetical protein BCF44_126104 [Kutzneria buriramensis]|uniref:Uncharacterized protein n=1 Tax=Kutzneria buriramensis TaxID=1045776 RepID=A0A3E0GUP3_9PSEU|nr:hypothetical protein BCF44_126104 [Kutzneria buriramensis]